MVVPGWEGYWISVRVEEKYTVVSINSNQTLFRGRLVPQWKRVFYEMRMWRPDNNLLKFLVEVSRQIVIQ